MVSVDEYLDTLGMAQRSPETTDGYRKVLKSFAEFQKVPLDELENHLTEKALMGFAKSRMDSGRCNSGTGTALRILNRFYKQNGVVIAGPALSVIQNPGRQKGEDEPEDVTDKPLTTDMLQKMMDHGTPHSRAIISFLISTGCRAGETAKLKLSSIGRLENGKVVPDIDGDVIEIPHTIAKGKVKNGRKTGGGLVFLTSEARQYLTDWLKQRDKYIEYADIKAKTLKGIHARPVKDDRIFANHYNSMQRAWDRLYTKVDGEHSTWKRNRCTMHSCRKYFRTHAVESMPIDAVEKIMRHSGYLTTEYVRYTPEELRNLFHKGEASLYITRADHRVQAGALDALKKENQELRESLQRIEGKQQAMTVLDKEQGRLTPEDHAAIAKLLAEEMRKDRAVSS